MIDLIFLGLLGLAAWKGLREGMVKAVFSFAAFFIGLAAALKLSAATAAYLQDASNRPSPWWPALAFILVMFVVGSIVRFGGSMVEKTIDVAMLGWLNTLAGFLLYAILYTLFYSVVLFYFDQLFHISPKTKADSSVYAYIEPWGAWTMDMIGRLIPAFRDVFKDMQEFFGRAADRYAPKS